MVTYVQKSISSAYLTTSLMISDNHCHRFKANNRISTVQKVQIKTDFGSQNALKLQKVKINYKYKNCLKIILR